MNDYLRWATAKRRLFELLKPTREQAEVLQKFFEYHIFEIGCDFTDYRMKDEPPETAIDKKAHILDRCIREIGHKIIEQKLFHETHNNFGHQEVTRVQVLVVGTPDLVKTREGKLIPLYLDMPK